MDNLNFCLVVEVVVAVEDDGSALMVNAELEVSKNKYLVIIVHIFQCTDSLLSMKIPFNRLFFNPLRSQNNFN